MTKFVKMSLAAAVAVAGINTTVSAKTLEEAIKGVEVSGYLNYRKEYKTVDSVNTADKNEYNLNVTLTSKVNDMVSATVSAGFDETTTANDGDTTTTATKDTSAPVGVDQAYFTFVPAEGAAIMAGKQNIPSPFVDQADTVAQGAGVVAAYTVSDALSLAGAHFWNNNIADKITINEIIASGNAAMVSYSLNYNTVVGGASDATRYSIDVAADFDVAKAEVRYTSSDVDANSDSADLTKVIVSAKAGPVAVKAAYGMTSKHVSTNALVFDNDAKAGFKSWLLSLEDQDEASAYILSASMNVVDSVNVKVQYASGEADAANTWEETETLAQVKYNMSKNFYIFGRYSVLTNELTDKDTTLSRLMLNYSF